MGSTLELLVHNIGYIVTILINIGLGIAVFYKNPKKLPNIAYFLTAVSVVIFGIAYLLGVNTSDPSLSRIFLLFTMTNILTVCLNAYFAFSTMNKIEEHKKGLIACFAGAAALLIFFLTDTTRFLVNSTPKLYFPNYYEPGRYYWLFLAFFMLVVSYFIYYLAKECFTTDEANRNRLKYCLFAFVFAYVTGSFGFLPTFHIYIDPLISMIFGLYTIPLAYGILKYELLDVHVVAKRASVYAVLTAVFSVVISLISFSNTIITETIPNFPVWIIPFTTSLLSVGIGALVWEKLKDADVLKYEFINNVTHKFRTPLTHIRWLAEELRDETDQTARDKAVSQIQDSSMRLFELTNIVIDVAHSDNDEYLYKFVDIKLDSLINDLVSSHAEQIANKNLKVEVVMDKDIPIIKADERRLNFAIQILFENALIYTPRGGSVKLWLVRQGKELLFKIADSGIGIPSEELPYLFAKFYRAQNARRTDTEGMGLGLFMAKEIVSKHEGRIWAESEGAGKGSTFSFTLPFS